MSVSRVAVRVAILMLTYNPTVFLWAVGGGRVLIGILTKFHDPASRV